jgi:uncharacterized protein YgiM (DUF1202 family)
MEALALSHSFVAYEFPNTALVGVAGLAVALSVVSVTGEAQAAGYSHHRGYERQGWAEASEHHRGRGHHGWEQASERRRGYENRGWEEASERNRGYENRREYASQNGYAEVATNGGRLNIRHRPNECARVIGKLYNGDNVALTGRYRNGWAQLQDGGWVSSSWLS